MAKALAGQPEVLLLDEVMAGLNEAELAASVEIARNVRDELGTAILWVEHVMSASPARRASHRPQLRQRPGRGRARGRHAELQVVDAYLAGSALLEVAGLDSRYLGGTSSRASTSRFAPVRR